MVNVSVIPTVSELTGADKFDHFLARWGVNRSGHKVLPGLYSLGKPEPSSPVFVTANYTLSFDALRASLAGFDAYILVLDTTGINVWCAAGKGTFGTDNLIESIEESGLSKVVNHKRLILPQLGAPGVSAHEVMKKTGFKVEYGPILSTDISHYLKSGKVSDEMRQVRFNLGDRAVLIPVEFVHIIPYMLGAGVLMFFAGEWLAAFGAISAFLAGSVLFPLLLPVIPTREFSSKGFILGVVTALAFAVPAFIITAGHPLWWRILVPLAYILAMPPITAFLALNFTGSTTFTSKSGVEREMNRWIPVMAWWFGSGLVLVITLIILKLTGVVT